MKGTHRSARLPEKDSPQGDAFRNPAITTFPMQNAPQLPAYSRGTFIGHMLISRCKAAIVPATPHISKRLFKSFSP
jgi:hypothetical protein